MENNLQNTSTDMAVGVLANDQKLISTARRWNYGDNDSDSDSDTQQDTDIENNDDDRESEKNYSNETNTSESNRHEQPRREFNTPVYQPQMQSRLTEREIKLKKMDLFYKLKELKKTRNIKLTEDYDFQTAKVEDLEDEYTYQKTNIEKDNMVTWFGHMLVGGAKGLEFLSDSYNPFDFSLNGLSNNISDDFGQYQEVLGDIVDKYHVSGKPVAPELRLCGLLLMSCFTVAASGSIKGAITGSSNNNSNSDPEIDRLREKAIRETKTNTSNHFVKKENEKKDAMDKLEQNEKEYMKYQQAIKKNKNNFVLTTEQSDIDNDNGENHFDNIPRFSKSEIEQRMQRNRANEQRAFEKLNSKTMPPKRKEYLNMKAQEMDNIMDQLDDEHPDYNHNDNNDNNSDGTTESTLSRMSVNENIDRIMSETSDKSDRINLKKLNDIDDIELDNISFSSSNGEKRGRKKKKVNYAELSAASSKKGKKSKVHLS